MPLKKSSLGTVALLCLVAAPGGASAAQASTDSPSPVALRATRAVSKTLSLTPAEAAKRHAGWSSMTWTTGEAETTQAAKTSGEKQTAAPSTTQATTQATAVCTIYVGPVSLPNGVYGNLEAEVDQTCSGSFGVQKTRAHFEDERWYGWQRYSSDQDSGTTSNTYLNTVFAVDCGGGNQGTYNYRLVAQGYATSPGWSKAFTYGGSQSQRFACGHG